MSLPLRHSLENVSSLDRALEDLLVRFIINVPAEDSSSVERELFHFEEASWFYTDFIRIMNPTLPSLKIKSFANHIIQLCPLVWKWDIKADQALHKFSLYKKTIPVRGAAIFNQKLNKILLVQGTESDSWSFPRGKISKDEDDVDCCIREVKEEIGFDLTSYIQKDQFIERNIQGKNYKIFIVFNIPDDFDFKPQVRNEIEKIEWKDFRKIMKSINKSNNGVKYYLINSMIRPLAMWVKRQRQIKGDDKLKAYAEEQLKLMLGLTKSEIIETSDPGRELLNMLHSTVQGTPMKKESKDSGSASQDDHESPLPNPAANLQPNMLLPSLNASNMMMPQMNQHFIPGVQPFAPNFPNFPFMPNTFLPSLNQLPINIVRDTSDSNEPITPNASHFGRPTFAGIIPESNSDDIHKQQQFHQPQNHNMLQSNQGTFTSSEYPEESTKQSRNELLDILQKNKIKEPVEETKPKIRLLKRNEDINSNDTSPNQIRSSVVINRSNNFQNDNDRGNDLLSLLRKPETSIVDNNNQQQQYNSMNRQRNNINNLNTQNINAKHSTSNIGSGSNYQYEEFEDSSSASSDDEEEENIEKKLEELEVEEPPKIGTLDREALDTNFFKNNDIPHKDEFNMSLNSNFEYSRNAENDNNNTNTNNIKQEKPIKFKILKRGEKLETQDNNNNNNNNNHNNNVNDSKSLLSLLKKSDDQPVNSNSNNNNTAFMMSPSERNMMPSLNTGNNNNAFMMVSSPHERDMMPPSGNEGNEFLKILQTPSLGFDMFSEMANNTFNPNNNMMMGTTTQHTHGMNNNGSASTQLLNILHKK